MPTNWTPERIAGARVAVEAADDNLALLDPHGKIVVGGRDLDSLIALARVGLSVVAPSYADVERVFCVLAWGSPERPVELASNEQMARAMAGNPELAARARAAIAAMGGGDDR